MKIVTDRTFRAEMDAVKKQMTQEVKGFYAQDVNQRNAYIEDLARMTRRQIEFAPVVTPDREAIKTAYETNATVFGVNNKIAQAVADISQYLELQDKDGKKVTGHWLNKLLTRPNDRFTFRRYMYGWTINKGLFGDAWTYAPKAAGKDRIIKEMYLIPSQRVAVEHGDYEKLFEGLVINGRKIEAADVFESFDYNLNDRSFFGTSKVVAAALYLSIIEKGMKREDTALQNGGVANLITPAAQDVNKMPPLPVEKESTEQALNANRNINRNLYLRMPVEVQELGNTPIDLNILDSHKEAVTALCFVYDLPVDLYYGQSKYENVREAKKAVYTQNAIPLLNEFGADLLSYCGLSQEFDLIVNTDKIEVLQADPYSVAKDMATIGAFTTNEIRTAVGWEPRTESWANEVRIPLGVSLGNEPTDISEVE